MGDRETSADLAARALDAVQRDPAAAVALARRALAGREGTDEVRAAAERATGLALRELNDLPAALRHLRRGVRLAERAGAEELTALSRMSLGYVLANAGHNTAALRAVSAALEKLTGAAAGRVRMQRGVVLHYCGRHAEAVSDYGVAVEIAQREGDRVLEARARNNRGLLLAGIARSAQDDLERATAIFRDLGMDLAAADAFWNIGVAAGQRGDVSGALRTFRAAEQEYQRLCVPRPALLLDRFELLLSVPLIEEAEEVAAAAVAELSRRRMASDLAEALLAQARVALLDGDAATATATAAQAGRRFRRQGRMAWTALARHVELRAQFQRGIRSARLLTAMTRNAALLDTAHWTGPAQATRIDAAHVAAATGRPRQARELLTLAARARHGGVAATRGQAWYATALLRRLDGDDRGATVALRRGLAVLDAYRASLGATELRSHSGVHGQDLAREGLDLALASGRPAEVLAWAERCRATALRMAPVSPPRDPALAQALAELRLVSTALAEALADGRSGQLLRGRQVRLEQEIRDLTRRAEGGGPVEAPPTVRQLGAALGDAVLVELIVHRGKALAVVVADGRAGLHDLGTADPVLREVRLHLFSLRRLILLGDSTSARAAARRAAEVIDAALLRPLHQDIERRPLVLVPAGLLHGVPWSALPSCVGRPVSVAPAAAVWLRASGRVAPAGGPVLVAGPRLPAACVEVAALARQLPAARVLVGAAATASDTLRALDGAGLAHIAAHGTFRADNPLFSTLELADGPLTGYELERLRRPPGCLVLSACDAGRSGVRPGEELIGFTAVLLGLGTRCLIASLLPVPAERTTALMLDLHRRMATGYGPAQALAEAQREYADGTDGVGAATAAAFVCSGAG